VNDPGGGKHREHSRANTDSGGDSKQQIDTSTADATRSSCGNNITDMNDCQQLVAAITTRANAAKHKADTNDATGEIRFMTYGAKDDDNLTGESTDVMAPDDDPRQDNMVTENDEITDEDIDDVITEFSSIDMSDCETLTENVTESETEMARDFRRAQNADKALDSYRTRAEAGSREYVIKDGLLLKHAPSSATTTDPTYVLVLPKSHETETIRAAHSSLFGGHLGVRKTVQRISNDFFLPRAKSKIARYVRCCHEYQMTRGIKTKDRQPMQKVEVINQPPFSDLTVDFLGCTNVTQHVIKVTDNTCCYQPAYRIPEALRSAVQQVKSLWNGME